MTTTILPTRNTEWGFWGTIDRIDDDLAADAPKAWTQASQAIAAATGVSPEGVRDFLDSRHGRHFADDAANALARGDTLKEEVRQMGGTVVVRPDSGDPAVVPIDVPPLNARRDDIPDLAAHRLRALCDRAGRALARARI